MKEQLVTVLLVGIAGLVSGGTEPPKKGRAEHVVVVVWDGMRPDFVSEKNAPTLAHLARAGVWFENNHAVYPSSTNVNGAALFTGVVPARSGILGNHEFIPAIDPLAPFDTSDFPALDRPDQQINGRFIHVPTIAELVQKAGSNTVVAGSKMVAQLADRSRLRDITAARSSVMLFGGRTLPKSAETAITSTLGLFPESAGFPKEKADEWTTRALTEVLWKEGVPKYSVLWLGEPDLSQHETAPGSPTALAATKSSDRNLAKVLDALRAKNALATTDIFVVSDHGFSTIDLAFDLAERLRAAGFDALRQFTGAPKPGQVLVVSLGGSSFLYVPDHDPAVVRRLVDFLERSDFAGVILTRDGLDGTFPLERLDLRTNDAPDVVVAARWKELPNKFGAPGAVASDIGKGAGQGTHTSMSPHDMHNTLVASGPDFRSRFTDKRPSGNIDVAPTVLWILGIQAPEPLDGRVLTEALRDFPADNSSGDITIEAHRDLGRATWSQTVRLTTVGQVEYLVEGNGGRIPK